jgi:arylsulfatase A-like enzyme
MRTRPRIAARSGAALSLLLALSAGCHTPSSTTRAPSAPPNILLILADDLGYADLGFTGCTDIPTPHLDALAREGVFCTDAHVTASVCAPSRAGLITGRYPQRQGFECNLANGEGLLAGTETFPALLRRQGYTTALIGKWHLGTLPHNHPRALGFDHFSGLIGGSRSYFPEEKPPGPARRLERDGVPVPESDFTYLTDWLTDEGIRRIESRDRDRPLFLLLSYTAPHTPMHARPDLLERFSTIESPRRRKYAALVAALDEGVGRLRATLTAEGIAEETLIVFLSDNGGATNNASDNGGWRGMKGSKWEGGHRVPWIAHWPARFPAGRQNALISSLDLAPTFLAAAGAPPLAEADGLDLLPLLEGRGATPPREELYWRRAVAASVRQGSWKLIRVEEPDGRVRPPILVDLSRDPGEVENRAEAEPERVRALEARLAAWEAGLIPPRWLTAEVWRENQRKKHEIDRTGREAERKVP